MSNPWGSPLSSEMCYTVGSGWDGNYIDPRYKRTFKTGCFPGQTQAWNKVLLGWIPKSRQFVNPVGSHTINLEELAQPVSTTKPLYAVLRIGSSNNYYTVESRMKTGVASDFTTGYDENFPARKNGSILTQYVPGDPRGPVGCVVINHVYNDGPTHLVLMGTDDNQDGLWGDPGTCWEPGETWKDPTGSYKVRVNSKGSSSFSVTLTTLAPRGRFVLLTRSRILRTGTNLGGHPAVLGAAQTLSLKVLGVGGVPTTGVQAVVLNLHALKPSMPSALTVWPAGRARPPTPDLRTGVGDSNDALVTVVPGAQGKVQVFNAKGTTGLAVDVAGYYGTSPDGLTYQPVYPFRIAQYLTSGPIAPGDSQGYLVQGYTGIPLIPGMVAVLEVSAARSSAAGNLSVFTGGGYPPSHADFSFPAERLVTRLVIVSVGEFFEVMVQNGGSAPVAVTIQLLGYFAPGAPDVFHPVTRAHLMHAALTDGTPATVKLTGAAGVPSSGVDAILGIASISQASKAGYARLRPVGVTPATYCCGYDISYSGPAKNAIVPMVGPTGRATITSTADATVDIDVAGWFGPP
jgi:hypothetical protein